MVGDRYVKNEQRSTRVHRLDAWSGLSFLGLEQRWRYEDEEICSYYCYILCYVVFESLLFIKIEINTNPCLTYAYTNPYQLLLLLLTLLLPLLLPSLYHHSMQVRCGRGVRIARFKEEASHWFHWLDVPVRPLSLESSRERKDPTYIH